MNITVSKSFYHFTGWLIKDPKASLDKLKLILNSKIFKMNSHTRDWSVNSGYMPQTSIALSAFQVKMVCFTETPIEFLKTQIPKKGGCAIGMKRDWLIKSGGQNVIYVSKDHPNDYGRALTELMAHLPQLPNNPPALQAELMRRSKLTEAFLAATEDHAFYEEREWRIIRNPLNTFMHNDDVPFTISDIDSIWCSDTYLTRLHADLGSHPEYQEIAPLIKPVSALP